jgi:uncharacterized membrane protein
MMSAFLTDLRLTIIAGIIATALMVLAVVSFTGEGMPGGQAYLAFLLRWLHVISGIMWVGLLYYFNFVQMPSMAKIPDEQKPAIGNVIAPAVLFWFRWAAVATLATGLSVASLNGYMMDALTLGLSSGVARHTAIGIGMWLGLIMAFNVWVIIWPAQKTALGMIEAPPEAKAKAARLAMLTSRTNTLLTFPMLYAMVSAQNLY